MKNKRTRKVKGMRGYLANWLGKNSWKLSRQQSINQSNRIRFVYLACAISCKRLGGADNSDSWPACTAHSSCSLCVGVVLITAHRSIPPLSRGWVAALRFTFLRQRFNVINKVILVCTTQRGQSSKSLPNWFFTVTEQESRRVLWLVNDGERHFAARAVWQVPASV